MDAGRMRKYALSCQVKSCSSISRFSQYDQVVDCGRPDLATSRKPVKSKTQGHAHLHCLAGISTGKAEFPANSHGVDSCGEYFLIDCSGSSGTVFDLYGLIPTRHAATTNTMTPMATPTPIPAFAPVDIPLLALFKTVAVEEELEAADELVGIEEADPDVSVDDRSDDVVEDVIDESNVRAMVYRGEPPASEQHSVVSPQHHVVEESLPLHGVTITSRFAWDA